MLWFIAKVLPRRRIPAVRLLATRFRWLSGDEAIGGKAAAPKMRIDVRGRENGEKNVRLPGRGSWVGVRTTMTVEKA
jgi:hypothetical protein